MHLRSEKSSQGLGPFLQIDVLTPDHRSALKIRLESVSGRLHGFARENTWTPTRKLIRASARSSPCRASSTGASAPCPRSASAGRGGPGRVSPSRRPVAHGESALLNMLLKPGPRIRMSTVNRKASGMSIPNWALGVLLSKLLIYKFDNWMTWGNKPGCSPRTDLFSLALGLSPSAPPALVKSSYGGIEQTTQLRVPHYTLLQQDAKLLNCTEQGVGVRATKKQRNQGTTVAHAMIIEGRCCKCPPHSRSYLRGCALDRTEM